MSKNVEIRDFSRRRSFPGTRGSTFDVFLHLYDGIEKIPAPIFTLVLLALAALVTRLDYTKLGLLFGFFLADWLSLALLPRFQKSYGPAKPPALTLALMRSAVAWTPLQVFLPLQCLGVILLLYGFWIEPHRIRLTRQTLRTPKIEPGQSIRILHLGDLHVERITAREKQLQEWIERLPPDLILFSGDVLNLSYLDDPVSLAQARDILSRWVAPYGVYAVAGSPAVDLPELLPQIYDNLPVHFLDNQEVNLKIREAQFRLIGVNCSHKPFIDARYLPAREDPDDPFTILLYHSPDLAPQAAAASIDLQLSGHTHGGQVRLPLIGALFTGSLLGRQFSAGRYQVGSMLLYITRGLGMEGAGAPRVRFLCSPEIVFWEITGDKTAAS